MHVFFVVSLSRFFKYFSSSIKLSVGLLCGAPEQFIFHSIAFLSNRIVFNLSEIKIIVFKLSDPNKLFHAVTECENRQFSGKKTKVKRMFRNGFQN